MAYLDVIPLATAKEYLKVDVGFSADDNQITRMISSALRKIEKQTQHISYARDESYLVKNGSAIVWDYPINSVVDPAEYTEEVNYLNTCYDFGSADVEFVTLNVGYADPNDFPEELKDAALEMIDAMYYANSDDRKKDISQLAKDSINENRRFII